MTLSLLSLWAATILVVSVVRSTSRERSLYIYPHIYITKLSTPLLFLLRNIGCFLIMACSFFRLMSELRWAVLTANPCFQIAGE